MKTTQEILDYVKSRKEYYDKEINWCDEKISNADYNSNDYKVYDWLKDQYLVRLHIINELLDFIYERDI